MKAGSGGKPRIGLALGGGGARGLAHIAVLEALDDMGLRPALITGTSIGAVIGAAYAAGLSGANLRHHVLSLAADRPDVMAKLLKARVGRLTDLFAGKFNNPITIDSEIFLDHFWPQAVPDRFEDLEIPFMAIATDFTGRREALFQSGPLAPAVAASMAIPGLIRPVVAEGMLLVDGGAVNPLPYNHLFGKADIIIAVDVTGGPVEDSTRRPTAFQLMFGAAQIMAGSITAQMLKARAPDILLKPPVEGFRVLDFFKAAQIIEAAAPIVTAMRHELEQRLVSA
ncbi:MAG: patatin-like phospholipase family protein [Hyphomicrobiales bacterium]|nr:patatin-like phospholipase family protein [Hyphomicrobiales bacterium]